jgi:hypothetical protein
MDRLIENYHRQYAEPIGNLAFRSYCCADMPLGMSNRMPHRSSAFDRLRTATKPVP